MPNYLKILIFVLLNILLLTSCGTQSNSCKKTRAAFDIGSGTTKIKVATIDTCKKKILNVLFEENVHLGFKKDLVNKSSGKSSFFSKQIMNKGLEVFKSLVNKTKKFRPSTYQGVATSAFRKAKNAHKFISKVSNELGIKIDIIDQEKEAHLGYLSATLLNNDKNFKDIIVWDIGGGSMQIIAKKQNELLIYKGKIGSVGFKKQVISKILNKNPVTASSPNPLGNNNFNKATELAIETSKFLTNKDLRALFKKSTVYGIGGVHAFSIMGQVKTSHNFYTKEDIILIAPSRAGLNDKEINGKYADTEVTNLALVLGHMKGLNISKVFPKKINLTNSVLVYPEII